VPEPSSAVLLVMGAAGMAAYRKRRDQKKQPAAESTAAV